ncbi:hypothetical protein EDI_343810 [Entamoeba dispar SAW760]|uniref:Uncharacterized protein n=1 Tax=Entamoeba dispar (strain ATCC PRA-260 / SAW760) TaxID=370354 RepID=B0ESR2_ENTDS|nr:uncharacterized protein EDI_343810 [Entamoeba dispar SAW760]EDR22440.1 hypothetical protein EDI_343810 [Entamoeba dispar SAW760]|eukprot:EDR22440.1 hypothetical protein EDI_343810 [Entamoeba dispar SAW760]
MNLKIEMMKTIIDEWKMNKEKYQPIKRKPNEFTIISPTIYKEFPEKELFLLKYLNKESLSNEDINILCSFYGFNLFSKKGLSFIYLLKYTPFSPNNTIKQLIISNTIQTNQDVLNLIINSIEYIENDIKLFTIFQRWIFDLFNEKRILSGETLHQLLMIYYNKYPLFNNFEQFLQIKGFKLNKDQWVCLCTAASYILEYNEYYETKNYCLFYLQILFIIFTYFRAIII